MPTTTVSRRHEHTTLVPDYLPAPLGGTITQVRAYRLISGDSHVNEPPDLFLSRVPTTLRDRVPRIEPFDQGDAWIIEGAKDPINFGMNACAGQRPDELQAWVRFESIRRGGYDPAVRQSEMDLDGVDAEILYPTPRLCQGIVANPDPELHVAMVHAYNDWLSEYVAQAPERFGGLLLLPNCGPAAATAELHRVTGRPGIRGAVMGCYPNGTLDVTHEDDAVWEALVHYGLPVSIHVSLGQTMPEGHRSSLPGYGRFFDIPNRIVQMVFSGMFDRYPDLQLVCAEVDCGWVPYFKEQVDNNFQRLYSPGSTVVQGLPSEYIERQVSFTYVTDNFGINNRHTIGVDRILWSSDYPHVSSDWPNSWKTIQATFGSIPVGERHAILAGNAARLYGFDSPSSPTTAAIASTSSVSRSK
jgi:predicted TIM-barrel fold metal-dependent hydrolase